MNSDFYITLKKVKETRYEYIDAPFHLDNDYIDLQERVKGFQTKNIDQKKNYAIIAFNQIAEEKRRIEKFYNNYTSVDLRKLSQYELEEHDAEENYYLEILHSIDDALKDLLEELVGLFPERYKDEGSIKIIKEYSRGSTILTQFLFESGELKKNETINKGKKRNKLYPSTFEEIFYTKASANRSLKVLRTLNAIDSKNQKLNNATSGIFQLWYKELIDLEIIKPNLDLKCFAKVMSNKIIGLSEDRTKYSKEPQWPAKEIQEKKYEIRGLISTL